MSWKWLPCAIALLPSAGAAEVVVIRNVDDTAAYSFVPFIARPSNEPSLYAFSALDDQGGAHDFRTFLRFALPAELAGACVEAASVFVYYGFTFTGFGEGSDEPGELECRPILDDWSEGGVTWNDQPSIGSPVDAVSGIEAFGYVQCDVTPLVQDWLDGSRDNHGVALTSDTGRVMGFYSSESNQNTLVKPALSITIADDPLACPEPSGAAAALAALAALAAGRRR